MFEPLQTAFSAVPNSFFAFLAPPAIWANLAWASPFLKTKRHGLSGFVALIAGFSMFIALKVDTAYFMVPFVFGCLAMLAMLTIMLWHEPDTEEQSRGRNRRKKFR